MTNDEGSSNIRMTKSDSGFVIPSSLDVRHSSLKSAPIASGTDLLALVARLQPVARVAVDTEADSLHCYREKLCLLQVSVAEADFVVDPLADVDLAPLRAVLEEKEIVLHGADYDLRLLRRSLNFSAQRIFDTVIAARLLGIREFSLLALVKKYFGIELTKGSQKANWARRPLPERMLEYAVNDTHYLLPLADKLAAELRESGRFDWFEQSCVRAIEQATVDRTRDADEVWRIAGAGALQPRAGAVLRELWRWREKEAEAADRPSFHILQNHELLRAAETFASGGAPDYRHFSMRRRNAFRKSAEEALRLPEEDWPVLRRRSGTRPTAQMVRRADELKHRRNQAAGKLKLEPTVLAPRSALEAIASDEASAQTVLMPWQRELLGFST
jgi:ribonuclease D